MAGEGTNVAADTEVIAGKVVVLEDAVAAMRATIGKVDTEVSQTGGWKGGARDAFGAAVIVWGDESKDLNARLDDLVSAAKDGTVALDRMEEENEDAFRGTANLTNLRNNA